MQEVKYKSVEFIILIGQQVYRRFDDEDKALTEFKRLKSKYSSTISKAIELIKIDRLLAYDE